MCSFRVRSAGEDKPVQETTVYVESPCSQVRQTPMKVSEDILKTMLRSLRLSLWLCWTFLPAYGQLSFLDNQIAVHGAFSQGYMISSGNDYLTLPTTSGSFAFTDASVNISASLTSKLRVGAQGYDREVGQLGKGHVVLDWALVDYRFSDFFGVRAGKVKTVFGLYNDTQDQEFLHTWALLPQAVYPLDLRGAEIAHTGSDIYGTIPVSHVGSFLYTAYAGLAPADLAGGFQYADASFGTYVGAIKGTIEGVDLKWQTPVPGLLAGAGLLSTPQDYTGVNLHSGGLVHYHVPKHENVFSLQYAKGNWHLDGEYTNQTNQIFIQGLNGPTTLHVSDHPTAGYGAIAYRVNKHLELGTYRGLFFSNLTAIPPGAPPEPAASKHIFDQAVTVRFDITRFCDFKIEGHFIDGYGSAGSFRGFYPQDNPSGLKPRTDLLVLRLGFNI